MKLKIIFIFIEVNNKDNETKVEELGSDEENLPPLENTENKTINKEGEGNFF